MSPVSSPGGSLLAATAIVAIGFLFIALGSFRSSTDNSQPAEIELIILRPAGFEPFEITRSKGAFVLYLDDRSGKENSSLILQNPSGERLRAINIERRKSNWHEVVDLSPGTYILQDESNAQLRCQITILP